MTAPIEQYRNQIIQGHALEILKSMEAESVDCIITSPPYWGLRDYGTEPLIWDSDPECNHIWGDEIIERKRGIAGGHTARCRNTKKGLGGTKTKQGQFCQKCGAWLGNLGCEPTIHLYLNHLVDIFREIRRVLKDWGTVWIVIGDSYAGSGGAGEWSKRKAGKQEYAGPRGNNVNRFPSNGLKPKDLCGVPWELARALRADRWWLRRDIVWSKKNCMPESIQGTGWYRHRIKNDEDKLIDCPGCEKCEANDGYVFRWNAGRPTTSHEYIFLLTKSDKYFYDLEAVLEDCSPNTHKRISQDIANQIGSYRASGGRKTNGPMKAVVRTPKQVGPGQGIKNNDSFNNAICMPVLKRNKRSVWNIATQSFSGPHFATFPLALIEPCIRAGTSQKGNCPECGKPWVRIIEKGFTDHIGKTESQYKKGSAAKRLSLLRQAARERGQEYFNDSKTLGWKPSCSCGTQETVNPIVLDPFMGRGTTALISKKLNRDFVGIELKEEYVAMSNKLLKSEMPLFL